jgi:hypothetical protein
MSHNYPDCTKSLEDCSWCRAKAEKLCEKSGIDTHLLDWKLRFSEHPILMKLPDSHVDYLQLQEEDRYYGIIVEEIRKLADEFKHYFKKTGTNFVEATKRLHGIGKRVFSLGYVKGKWGSGKLVKRIANDAGFDKSYVYIGVRLVEKFPDTAELEKFLKVRNFDSLKNLIRGLYRPSRKPKTKVTKPQPTLASPIFQTKERSTETPLPVEEFAFLTIDIMSYLAHEYRVEVEDVHFSYETDGDYGLVHVWEYKDRQYGCWIPVCEKLRIYQG